MKRFLDDNSISSQSEDSFGHRYIANQIGQIIKEHDATTPINIGVFGKWGVGKSSIIELLKNETLKNEITSDEIKLITVNVWKYQSINSIRNIIFYQIANSIGLEDKIKFLYENTTTSSNEFKYKALLRRFVSKNYLRENQEVILQGFFIALIIGFLLLILYRSSNSAAALIASYILPIVTSAAILKIGVDYFLKAFISTTTVQSKPFESEEQFEHGVIKLFNESKYKDCKKILFIDDLDRCSSNKVLNTLETIKTFLQIENCIFIIASDSEIIKKAVIESNKDFNYTEQDGANYLEKFFQHFIFIPPFMAGNLRDYTKRIIDSAQLDIVNSLTKDQLDNIIYILAYKDIINPRKIKILINSFVFEYYSIKDKETDVSHLIKDGFITGSPEVLAILVILKIDFPLFVNDLIVDPLLAYNIAHGHDSEIELEEMRERYKQGNPNLKYFLSLIKDWLPFDITPYLFVTMESANLSNLSIQEYRKVSNLIRNGHFDELKDELKNKAIDFCQEILLSVGHWQATFSNGNEKRKASLGFVLLMAEYFDFNQIQVSLKEGLYAFKTNFDTYLNDSSFCNALEKSGMVQIVNSYVRFGQEEYGLAILNSFSDKLGLSTDNLVFLQSFLTRRNFPSLISHIIKARHLELFTEQITKLMTDEKYQDVLGNLLSGKDFDKLASSEYLLPVISHVIDIESRLHSLKIEDERKAFSELTASDISFNEDIWAGTDGVSALLKFVIESEIPLVAQMLRLMAETSVYLYSSLIYYQEIKIKGLVESSQEDSRDAIFYILTEWVTIPTTNIFHFGQVDTCLRLIGKLLENHDIITAELNNIIIECLKKSIGYLQTVPDDDLSELVAKNIDGFFKVSIFKPNARYLITLLSGFKDYPIVEGAIFNSLIKIHAEYQREDLAFERELLKMFLTFLNTQPAFSMVEEHLKKNMLLLNAPLLNEQINSDKALLENVKLLVNNYESGEYQKVKTLVSLISSTGDLLEASCISKINENVDSTLSFALDLLLIVGRKKQLNSIKDKLIEIYTATYKNATSGRVFYVHVVSIRAKAIELLLTHLDYQFNGSFISTEHINLVLSNFTYRTAYIQAYNLLDKQHLLTIKTYQNQEKFLNVSLLLWSLSGYDSRIPIIQILSDIINERFKGNSSQKKNEILKILKAFFKKVNTPVEAAIAIKAKEKETLSNLYNVTTQKYSSLKTSWTNVLGFLKISETTKNGRKKYK